MKCNECTKSYVVLDVSCTWFAMCNQLGTSCGIGLCDGDSDCDGDCEDREPPEWDSDLGQNNQYCIHNADQHSVAVYGTQGQVRLLGGLRTATEGKVRGCRFESGRRC